MAGVLYDRYSGTTKNDIFLPTSIPEKKCYFSPQVIFLGRKLGLEKQFLSQLRITEIKFVRELVQIL